jgi:hypothetical protein
MTYDDYLRTWTVLAPVGEASRCLPNEKVTFEGGPEKVMIFCDTRQPYGEGTYDKDSHAIRSKNAGEYVISMVEVGTGRARIELTADGSTGSVAGSWTAEDQSSWPEREAEP